MEDQEQRELMKKFRFVDREVKWVIARAKKLEISVDSLLAELSRAFVAQIKVFILMFSLSFIIISFRFYDENIGEQYSVYITFFLMCLAIILHSPLRISFKSYRMLKSMKKKNQ